MIRKCIRNYLWWVNQGSLLHTINYDPWISSTVFGILICNVDTF